MTPLLIRREFLTNVAPSISFLLLAAIFLQSMGTDSAAQPTITGYGHFVDRFGPHSIPLLPVGDEVQIGVFLDSVDSIGSPTISVQVTQGDTTLTLDALDPGHPLYLGEHLYYKFIDYDPSLTGEWEITASDSTGNATSVFTNSIAAPEFLPFAQDVVVQGTSLNARVSWSLPNFTGFDVDGIGVRVIEASTGHHVWQSDLLTTQTTSLQPPAGILQKDVDYVYWVNLVDIEGDYLENSSKAFSAPFRLTVAGDYNQNGVVDAADYTVWRNSMGSTALVNRGVGVNGPIGVADYAVWKTHFGESIGAGSGSALPSAESLSASIPEPSSFLLCAIAAMLVGRRYRR